MNSPVRLEISLAAAIITGFYSQRFWGFLSPCWYPGLRGLSHSPVVPPSLSLGKCGTASYCLAQFTSCHLATSPFHPGCPSPLLLQVWMKVSFLTPWFLDLHTVQFFWQFWLFFVFKFVVVLFVVQGGKVCLPMPTPWPEVSILFFWFYSKLSCFPNFLFFFVHWYGI